MGAWYLFGTVVGAMIFAFGVADGSAWNIWAGAICTVLNAAALSQEAN